jgi:glucokinase
VAALSDDLVLAVDLGGTKIEAAVVSEGGIVEGTRARRTTGPTKTAEQLDDAVREVVAEAVRDHRVRSIGIGSAGPVDASRGVVSPLNLPVWRDHPIVAVVSGVVPGVPVTLAIDGLAIALAEHRYGAGRGSRNLLGMVVSTGVGGGLVLDDRGFAGETGNAGHIGHIEVAGFADPCPCGGRGCLEAVASGPSSVRWARSEGWQGDTGEHLAADAASGVSVARSAIQRSARAVGQALASATGLLDLDVIAVGGGFSHSAPDYLELVRAEFTVREWAFVKKVRILPAGLGGEAPLIGAALLAD